MNAVSSRNENSHTCSVPLSPVEERGPEAVVISSETDGDDGKQEEATATMSDEEGHAPRVLSSPGQPSQKEREKHAVSHIPFRSWCDHCVRGRGRDRQSRLIAEGMKAIGTELPRIVMDYGFFSVNAQGADCKGSDPGMQKPTKHTMYFRTHAQDM